MTNPYYANADKPENWLHDKHGNKVDIDYWGFEEAQKALDSLRGCTNCINCVGRTNCENCIHCSLCQDCQNIVGAYDAKNITGIAPR